MRKNVGGRDRTTRIVLGPMFVATMMVTVAFGVPLGGPTQVMLVATVLLLVAFAFLGAGWCREMSVQSRAGAGNTYEERAVRERP